MARGDFRKRLTDRLIEYMEENDGLPWDGGWSKACLRPFNPRSGVKYRGGNVLNLMLGAVDRNSDDPRWLTLKQANAIGCRVTKGAKGELVEYWDWGQPKVEPKPEPEVEAEQPATQDESKDSGTSRAEAEDDKAEEPRRRKPLVFFAVVFNGKDIEGLPELRPPVNWEANDEAERLISATGARIEHRALSKVGRTKLKENEAYWVPATDTIVVPPRAAFRNASDYYATVLHELAHWTGHESRLDRRRDRGKPGTPEYNVAYAKEELRAEIAALFLTSQLGIQGKVQGHAKYVAAWLDVLKNDKHEIFRAARDADRIVEHLLDYAPELRDALEGRVDGNVVKTAPRRPVDAGLASLPDFGSMPEKEATGTGRKDSRWPAFEAAVRGEAKRYEIADAAVSATFDLLEPQFTALMDSAQRNGYTTDDMHAMLVAKLLEEMRSNNEREAQWERFCAQVSEAAVGLMSEEDVAVALHQARLRFQAVLVQSLEEGWDQERTNAAVREVVFGPGGRRPITPEFVRETFLGATAQSEQVAEDELVLVPFGADFELEDADPAMTA